MKKILFILNLLVLPFVAVYAEQESNEDENQKVDSIRIVNKDDKLSVESAGDSLVYIRKSGHGDNSYYVYISSKTVKLLIDSVNITKIGETYSLKYISTKYDKRTNSLHDNSVLKRDNTPWIEFNILNQDTKSQLEFSSGSSKQLIIFMQCQGWGALETTSVIKCGLLKEGTQNLDSLRTFKRDSVNNYRTTPFILMAGDSLKGQLQFVREQPCYIHVDSVLLDCQKCDLQFNLTLDEKTFECQQDDDILFASTISFPNQNFTVGEHEYEIKCTVLTTEGPKNVSFYIPVVVKGSTKATTSIISLILIIIGAIISILIAFQLYRKKKKIVRKHFDQFFKRQRNEDNCNGPTNEGGLDNTSTNTGEEEHTQEQESDIDSKSGKEQPSTRYGIPDSEIVDIVADLLNLRAGDDLTDVRKYLDKHYKDYYQAFFQKDFVEQLKNQWKQGRFLKNNEMNDAFEDFWKEVRKGLEDSKVKEKIWGENHKQETEATVSQLHDNIKQETLMEFINKWNETIQHKDQISDSSHNIDDLIKFIVSGFIGKSEAEELRSLMKSHEVETFSKLVDAISKTAKDEYYKDFVYLWNGNHDDRLSITRPERIGNTIDKINEGYVGTKIIGEINRIYKQYKEGKPFDKKPDSVQALHDAIWEAAKNAGNGEVATIFDVIKKWNDVFKGNEVSESDYPLDALFTAIDKGYIDPKEKSCLKELFSEYAISSNSVEELKKEIKKTEINKQKKAILERLDKTQYNTETAFPYLYDALQTMGEDKAYKKGENSAKKDIIDAWNEKYHENFISDGDVKKILETIDNGYVGKEIKDTYLQMLKDPTTDFGLKANPIINLRNILLSRGKEEGRQKMLEDILNRWNSREDSNNLVGIRSIDGLMEAIKRGYIGKQTKEELIKLFGQYHTELTPTTESVVKFKEKIDAEKGELIAAHNEEKQKLQNSIHEMSQSVNAGRDRMIAQVKQRMDEIGGALEEINTRVNEVAGQSQRFLNYMSRLKTNFTKTQTAIDKLQAESWNNDEVTLLNVKEDLVNLFKQNLDRQPDWMNNLTVLNTYARIAKLNDELESKGVSTVLLEKACASLNAMVGQVDIAIIVPSVLASKTSDTDFDYNSTVWIDKLLDCNIPELKEDAKGRIIDIVQVGYSYDGEIKKPEVHF